MNEMHDLKEWISAIAVPQDNLGGMAICPFASLAGRFTMDRVEGELIPPTNLDFDVHIYLLPDSMSCQSMIEMCDNLNADYGSLIFLPDHKDRNTFINGVQTNNGRHNIILCQPKEKLRLARKALMKTKYYTYWSEDYLREIFGEDYGNLD